MFSQPALSWLEEPQSYTSNSLEMIHFNFNFIFTFFFKLLPNKFTLIFQGNLVVAMCWLEMSLNIFLNVKS